MSATVATETAPVTVLLRLERRGRRATRTEFYEQQIAKKADATLEDFKPFVLEKSGEAFGRPFVSRTQLVVEQYDPAERRLLLSHSLPASQAAGFTFDLECGHGFKQVQEPAAAPLTLDYILSTSPAPTTRQPRADERLPRVGKLCCADGTTLSVQAGEDYYCTPRTNTAPYTEVEVGALSAAPDETWAKHFDGGIYARVPVWKVRAYIHQHGGLA